MAPYKLDKLFEFFGTIGERRTRRGLYMRGGFEILSFAALTLLVGCAGLSTSTSKVVDSGGGASTHTVDLSWSASTSADVAGYNVYRAVYGTSCGPFTKINSTLIASTLYTDSQVMNGSSYCYATTAVDTNNQESGYSNIASDIQIPAS